jgi:hypothetical protein
MGDHYISYIYILYMLSIDLLLNIDSVYLFLFCGFVISTNRFWLSYWLPAIPLKFEMLFIEPVALKQN